MGPGRGVLHIAIEVGLWLGLACAAFGLTFKFSNTVGTYAWGAASWPRAVILLIVLVALAQLVLRLWQGAINPEADAGGGTGNSSGAPARLSSSRLKMTAVFALPLVYVLLLPHTGFYVTTPVFLAAYLLLLGERRPTALVICPLVIYVLINLVFTKLFYVALPTGNLPGFYDVSNWLLVTIR